MFRVEAESQLCERKVQPKMCLSVVISVSSFWLLRNALNCVLHHSTLGCGGPPSLAADLRFLVEPVDQTVRLNQPGDAIALNCTAEGFPLPAVSLYKGVTQVAGVTVEATQTAVSVALVIDPPGTSDAGSYSCAAENSFGRVVSQTATVYVTGECGRGCGCVSWRHASCSPCSSPGARTSGGCECSWCVLLHGHMEHSSRCCNS